MAAHTAADRKLGPSAGERNRNELRAANVAADDYDTSQVRGLPSSLQSSIEEQEQGDYNDYSDYSDYSDDHFGPKERLQRAFTGAITADASLIDWLADFGGSVFGRANKEGIDYAAPTLARRAQISNLEGERLAAARHTELVSRGSSRSAVAQNWPLKSQSQAQVQPQPQVSKRNEPPPPPPPQDDAEWKWKWNESDELFDNFDADLGRRTTRAQTSDTFDSRSASEQTRQARRYRAREQVTSGGGGGSGGGSGAECVADQFYSALMRELKEVRVYEPLELDPKSTESSKSDSSSSSSAAAAAAADNYEIYLRKCKPRAGTLITDRNDNATQEVGREPPESLAERRKRSERDYKQIIRLAAAASASDAGRERSANDPFRRRRPARGHSASALLVRLRYIWDQTKARLSGGGGGAASADARRALADRQYLSGQIERLRLRLLEGELALAAAQSDSLEGRTGASLGRALDTGVCDCVVGRTGRGVMRRRRRQRVAPPAQSTAATSIAIDAAKYCSYAYARSKHAQISAAEDAIKGLTDRLVSYLGAPSGAERSVGRAAVRQIYLFVRVWSERLRVWLETKSLGLAAAAAASNATDADANEDLFERRTESRAVKCATHGFDLMAQIATDFGTRLANLNIATNSSAAAAEAKIGAKFERKQMRNKFRHTFERVWRTEVANWARNLRRLGAAEAATLARATDGTTVAVVGRRRQPTAKRAYAADLYERGTLFGFSVGRFVGETAARRWPTRPEAAAAAAPIAANASGRAAAVRRAAYLGASGRAFELGVTGAFLVGAHDGLRYGLRYAQLAASKLLAEFGAQLGLQVSSDVVRSRLPATMKIEAMGGGGGAGSDATTEAGPSETPEPSLVESRVRELERARKLRQQVQADADECAQRASSVMGAMVGYALAPEALELVAIERHNSFEALQNGFKQFRLGAVRGYALGETLALMQGGGGGGGRSAEPGRWAAGASSGAAHRGGGGPPQAENVFEHTLARRATADEHADGRGAVVLDESLEVRPFREGAFRGPAAAEWPFGAQSAARVVHEIRRNSGDLFEPTTVNSTANWNATQLSTWASFITEFGLKVRQAGKLSGDLHLHALEPKSDAIKEYKRRKVSVEISMTDPIGPQLEFRPDAAAAANESPEKPPPDNNDEARVYVELRLKADDDAKLGQQMEDEQVDDLVEAIMSAASVSPSEGHLRASFALESSSDGGGVGAADGADRSEFGREMRLLERMYALVERVPAHLSTLALLESMAG